MNKLMKWIILLYKCHVNKLMDLRHTFKIMNVLKTEIFILNSSQTSLNIYGNCKASRRNFFFFYVEKHESQELECVSY